MVKSDGTAIRLRKGHFILRPLFMDFKMNERVHFAQMQMPPGVLQKKRHTDNFSRLSQLFRELAQRAVWRRAQIVHHWKELERISRPPEGTVEGFCLSHPNVSSAGSPGAPNVLGSIPRVKWNSFHTYNPEIKKDNQPIKKC